MKTKFEVGQKDASETLFILKCTQLSMENDKKLAFGHFTKKLFGYIDKIKIKIGVFNFGLFFTNQEK